MSVQNGSCWDVAPSVGHNPMPTRCELAAGHLGAHRSGMTEWMRGAPNRHDQPSDAQLDAAAAVIAEMTGEPRVGRFELTMARAVLKAAGGVA